MLLELLVAIETELGRSLDAERVSSAQTVADVEAFVREAQNARRLATTTSIEKEDELELNIPEPLREAAMAWMGMAQHGFYDRVLKTKVSGRAFIPHNRNSPLAELRLPGGRQVLHHFDVLEARALTRACGPGPQRHPRQPLFERHRVTEPEDRADLVVCRVGMDHFLARLEVLHWGPRHAHCHSGGASQVVDRVRYVGADVEDLDGAAEVDPDRDELGRALPPAEARGGDEEVEHDRLLPRPVDEHVAAGAEARQRALGGERGQDRGHCGVDRVAALAQRPGARLGGRRMPGGDDAAAGAHSALASSG